MTNSDTKSQLERSTFTASHQGHADPTATWIVGRDAFGDQAYIMHTVSPAFIAKLGRREEDGILSGLAYATSDDRSIYDFVWFEEFPSSGLFQRLMREAETALRSSRRSADMRDPT